MRAVLGIDAAWGGRNGSGVALAVERRRGAWECAAVAPTYEDFEHACGVDPRAGPLAPRLLRAAAAAEPRADVRVVAVDLPLARAPILARRPADDAISRAFGARGCSTHSPAPALAAVSAALHASFTGAGFALATGPSDPSPRQLLEVYPHLAVMALTGAAYRVPYKLARAPRYWPALAPAARRARLARAWRAILAAVGARIAGARLAVPARATLAELKRFEDALDALVCAWVAVEHLAGRTRAFGDADAAIWSPARC